MREHIKEDARIHYVITNGVRVISRAVNYAWDLKDPPGLLRNHLMAFAMLLASGLLLVAALGWVSVVGMVRSSWFAEFIEVVPGLDGPGVFTTRWPATVALVVVVGLIHFFVPAAKVRLRDVWLGAVITGLLWQMALNGFSWYLAEVANFSVHGSTRPRSRSWSGCTRPR